MRLGGVWALFPTCETMILAVSASLFSLNGVWCGPPRSARIGLGGVTMIGLRLRRTGLRFGLLGLLVGSVMLTLLVGSSAADASPSCTAASGTTTCAYSFTGAEQTFTVPSGVTTVSVDAIGAGGAAHDAATGGGRGAEVAGNLTVTPGDTLYVEVGGTPTNDAALCYAATPCSGGWNGGGTDLTGDPTFLKGTAGG